MSERHGRFNRKRIGWSTTPAATVAAFTLLAALATVTDARAGDPTPSPTATPTATAPAPVATEDPAVTTEVKAQFGAWQAGKIDRKLYSDEANKQLTDVILTQTAQQMSALGAPTKYTYLSTRSAAGSTAYVYLVDTPKQKVQMLLSLDAQQKINGIFFRPAP